MLIVRLFALFVALGFAGLLAAWMMTGDPAYRSRALRLLKWAALLLLLILSLFALERFVGPL
ncbi:MAG: hypothetical protein HYS20_08135 [Rhodocyclales bacterium]|nr:hypothetical protein [Rhodocyclales bacterium]